MYGYESLVVAHCHRALSKSLINLASISQFRRSVQEILCEDDNNDDENTSISDSSSSSYIHHASEAHRIAQDWFGVNNHVRLFPFKMTLAHALQAQIAVNIYNTDDTYFKDAIELLDQCLSTARNIFGSISFKVAQVHRLQSATYLSKKMFVEYRFLFFYDFTEFILLGIIKLKKN